MLLVCVRLLLHIVGTPLQNDIVEVWALLNFLMPSIFNAKLNFEQWLNVPLGAAPLGGPAGAGGDDQPHAITVTEEEKLLIIDRLHKARYIHSWEQVNRATHGQCAGLQHS